MITVVAFLAIALQLALTTATPVSRRSVVQSGQLIIVPSRTGQCEFFEHPYCNLYGYNHTVFPNGRGQNMGEARREFSDYEPLLRSQGQVCSEYLGMLLCFHYFHLCINVKSLHTQVWTLVLLPCRHICELAREGCEEFMPNGWPEHLNCSKLPEQDTESLRPNCAGPNSPTNPTGPRELEPQSGFGGKSLHAYSYVRDLLWHR